jgi:hypothetical protein
VARQAAAALVVVLGLVPGGARATPCELRGTPEHAVIEVRPTGGPAMRVELTGVPLVARFARRRAAAAVRSTGPLRFRGSAVELPLALERDVVAGGGRVRLSKATRIVRARPHDGGLRLDVRIAPRSTTGVRLPSVAVACDAVRVGEDPASEVRPTSAAAWLPRRHALALRARPRASGGLRMETSGARAVPLDHLARSGPWVRVRAAWSDGSAVEGWIERDALESVHFASGFGYGTWADAPRGRCSAALPAAGPGGYVGPATLRRGGTLHAAPGRGPWAEAADDIAVDVELLDRAAAWVRVIRLPGVTETCDRLDHAWVPRDQVELPSL